MKKGWVIFFFLLCTTFFLHLTITSANAEEPLQKAKWSLFIFLNGDNDLDEAGDEDINEMEVVGSSSAVNVVVQQDKFGKTGTKRYLIQKDSDTAKIGSQVVEELPEVDMGDWNELVKFVKWGIEKYPAEHYLVTIWNHGSGWDKYKRESVKGVSYDDTSNNHIKAQDLTLAFSEIKKINNARNIDLVGFDACLMGVAEIMEQLYGYVDYVASSEEVEPWDGWPYNDLLDPLIQNPKMSPLEFGKIIVDKYGASYSGGSQGKQNVTQSLVDLIHWPAFREILNSFTVVLTRNEEYNLNNIKKAISKTQSYYFSHYKDIGHFAKLLKEEAKNTPAIVSWSNILISSVNSIVVANFTSKDGLPNSNGIGAYIPPSKYTLDAYKDAYSKLYWSSLTSWGKFVESIYYPKFPILSFKNLAILDNNDRVEPGETVNIKTVVKNDGGSDAPLALISVESKSDFVKVVVGSAELSIPSNNGANNEVLDNSLQISIDPATPVGSEHTVLLILLKDDFVVDQKELKFVVKKPLDIVEANISTPHDYPLNFNQSWEYSLENGASIAIHFLKFDTEQRYDFVTVSDKDGAILAKYTGVLGNFWTDEFPVNYVKIVFTSDGMVNKYGFDIDFFGVTLLSSDQPTPTEPPAALPDPTTPTASEPEDEPESYPTPPDNEIPVD